MRHRISMCLLCLTLAAAVGCGREPVRLGGEELETADPEQLLQQAEEGDVTAQRGLGLLYLNGSDPRLPQDYEQAFFWCRKAAEQGDGESMLRVAALYERGLGVEQSFEEAVRWFKAAAAAGRIEAQYRLGGLYARGQGAEQDFLEAVKWYRMAAEQGHAASQISLGSMYEHGRGVSQDYRKAIRWYKEATRFWKPEAFLILGRLSAEGLGVEQDCVDATKWFAIAQKLGDGRAQEGIDFCAEQMTPEQTAQARADAERWRPTDPNEAPRGSSDWGAEPAD